MFIKRIFEIFAFDVVNFASSRIWTINNILIARFNTKVKQRVYNKVNCIHFNDVVVRSLSFETKQSLFGGQYRAATKLSDVSFFINFLVLFWIIFSFHILFSTVKD